MSTIDRIHGDATVPALCTSRDHEGFKINADMFAAHTKFRGVWPDGILAADCLHCGSTLGADPSEWDDEEKTEPCRMAIARPL